MNGEVCCILGVCCPPGSEAQANALAKEMHDDTHGGASIEHCLSVAKWMLKHFDLAPKGTVAPLVAAIVKHARAAK